MKKRYFWFILLIAGLIFIDQLSKQIVVNTMEEGEHIPLIDGVFSFYSHRNKGAAWGILQGQKEFFFCITVIAIFIFAYLAKDISFRKKPLYTIAMALLIGGAFGNFIDRMLFPDGVVDFLYFELIDFPIFNIADSFLSIGVFLLSLYFLFFEGKIKNAKKDN